jgi:alpha-galactosidase
LSYGRCPRRIVKRRKGREMNKRIVLVGAGSALFTRGLLGNLVTGPEFEDCTVVLMDINPEILSLMERYARKLVKDNGCGLRIETSTSLGPALDGADFVLCTLAANDREARRLEVEVPLEFGYHHAWGDTTGPAGVFRALRHIPIFLEIAAEMERRCPQAWLLNFTNPMAALCRAVSLRSGIKILGFCDAPPYFRRFIEREVLGFPEGSLETSLAGVDHLVWFLEMKKDGEDVYPLFRQRVEMLRKRFPATVKIFDTYGYYLSPGDEHVSEFFPFLLRNKASMRKYGLKDMDAAWHRERRKTLLDKLIQETASAGKIKPSPLPPEEEATDIIRSIVNDERKEYVASLPNRNVVSNLPEYAVVEAPIRLGAEIHQLPPVFIPVRLTLPLQASIVKDELTVEAALTGSRDLVFQAVLSCPLTSSIEQARNITSALFESLKDYLPVRFV